ncbi:MULTISPECIES: MauE/DoxX family redox-associated membrane protein [unclassified Agromyces]|uniref:MauE/DoxX family redox-associated membrane protein n=1 Tax=unclassified Agromyces TaxID=2639701 RepID=UPI0030147CDF
MSTVLITAPALILAGVMVASGIGKLRRPDDLTGWAELGVPSAFRREWLLRLHPWGELALGLALALLGGWLGALAGLASVALMGAYTWLIARALNTARQSGADAACACFGESTPVTRVTLVRNAWLLLVALLTTSTIWATPTLGGALAALGGEWGWIVALAAAAATSALIVWRAPERTEVAPRPTAGDLALADRGELEYIRTRTPAVPVTLGDGTPANLRTLSRSRPILLLAVSETCGSCAAVIERVPEWRALLPEVEVRMLVSAPPELSALTEREHPHTLHDPERNVRASIADWGTPAAVLLGIDGLLAGGPEQGATAILSFVDDIYESLHGERPRREESPGP